MVVKAWWLPSCAKGRNRGVDGSVEGVHGNSLLRKSTPPLVHGAQGGA
jgi:hypothetical protein